MNPETLFLWIQQGLSTGLLALGCFFVLTGAVGILRLPDFYTRMHPAGVADSMGAPLVLLGLMVLSGFSLTSLKLVLLILFLLPTSPTATHALAKAAYDSGLKPVGETKD